jgi:hypothetical protein
VGTQLNGCAGRRPGPLGLRHQPQARAVASHAADAHRSARSRR